MRSKLSGSTPIRINFNQLTDSDGNQESTTAAVKEWETKFHKTLTEFSNTMAKFSRKKSIPQLERLIDIADSIGADALRELSVNLLMLIKTSQYNEIKNAYFVLLAECKAVSIYFSKLQGKEPNTKIIDDIIDAYVKATLNCELIESPTTRNACCWCQIF